MELYRREFLIKMGGLIAATLAASSGAYMVLGRGASTIPKATKLDFDVFYKLSQWLTFRENLNKDSAQKMYAVFTDEPWGKEHILRVYNKIVSVTASDKEKTDIATFLQSDALEEGEQWFASHLITTWYLGIYYHEKRQTQRVLYKDALMFSAVNDVIPVPYLENVGYGEWADIPIGHK